MSTELGGHRQQQRYASPGLGFGVGGYLTRLGPLRLLQRSGDLLFFLCFVRANLSMMGLGTGQKGVCWAALVSGFPGRWVGCLPGMPPGQGQCLTRGATPQSFSLPWEMRGVFALGVSQGSALKRGGTAVLRGVLAVSRAHRGGFGLQRSAIKSSACHLVRITNAPAQQMHRAAPWVLLPDGALLEQPKPVQGAQTLSNYSRVIRHLSILGLLCFTDVNGAASANYPCWPSI